MYISLESMAYDLMWDQSVRKAFECRAQPDLNVPATDPVPAPAQVQPNSNPTLTSAQPQSNPSLIPTLSQVHPQFTATQSQPNARAAQSVSFQPSPRQPNPNPMPELPNPSHSNPVHGNLDPTPNTAHRWWSLAASISLGIFDLEMVR